MRPFAIAYCHQITYKNMCECKMARRNWNCALLQRQTPNEYKNKTNTPSVEQKKEEHAHP